MSIPLLGAAPTHVTNPAVVVEVLSTSTQNYDRGEKREHYQRMPSLQIYLLLESEQRHVELYRKDCGAWLHETLGGPAVATLAPIGCSLSVQELYDLAGIA